MSKARLLADLISDSQITASEITGLELNSIQEGDTVVEVVDNGSGGKVVVRVDGVINSEFTSNGIVVPSGTTAERDPSAALGSLRYNTTTGFFETFTVSGWGSIATPPSISSITPSNFNGEAGASFTVYGAFFDQATTAKFKGQDGTLYPTGTVTFVSSTEITITNSTNLPVSNEPFVIEVTNGAGLSTTSVTGIDAGSVPSFTTAAGNLATTTQWDDPISVTVQATDAENTITGYTLTQGNLPVGLTLDTATGNISGTSSEQATTTYTFTIGATDSAGNTNTRQFNIQIVNAAPVWVYPAADSTETIAINSSGSVSLSATDPEGSAVTYSATNLPTGLSISGSTISGTPTSSGTSYVSATASDGFAQSVRNFYINVVAPLYNFTTYTFHTAGGSGSVANGLSTFQSAYSGAPFLSYFAMNFNGYQRLTIPQDGTYEFQIRGASGADHSNVASYGGKSVDITLRHNLTQGQVITIICGHNGTTTNRNGCDPGAGGGGASAILLKSFTPGGTVTLANSEILAVAAGGGGSPSSPSYQNTAYMDAAIPVGTGETQHSMAYTSTTESGNINSFPTGGGWGPLWNDGNESSNGGGMYASGDAMMYSTSSNLSAVADMLRVSPPSTQPNQSFGSASNQYSESGFPLMYGWRGGYGLGGSGCPPLDYHSGGFGGGGGACHPGGGGGGFTGGGNGRFAVKAYTSNDPTSASTSPGTAGSSYINPLATFISASQTGYSVSGRVIMTKVS